MDIAPHSRLKKACSNLNSTILPLKDVGTKRIWNGVEPGVRGMWDNRVFGITEISAITRLHGYCKTALKYSVVPGASERAGQTSVEG